MSKIVNVPTQAQLDFSQPNKVISLPRREAARLLRLAINGTMVIAGAGPGSVGGAAPAPLQPLSLLQRLTLRKNPSGMQSELNFNTADLALLQNVVIPLKGRIAARTPPADNVAGSKIIYAELLVPYGLPNDGGESATPMASVDSWEVEAVGQASAVAAEAAIFTGGTNTFAYDTTDPINVSASVEFTDALPGGPSMDIAISKDRLVLDAQDKSFEIKSVSPGELPLLFVIQAWNNNARAVLPGGQGSFIEASYGAGEVFISERPAENVQNSAARYGIPDGSMPTGAYFVDMTAIFGSPANIPIVGMSGGIPTLRFRLGAATTNPAWVDVLTIRGRWTKKGLDRLAGK